MEALLYCCCGLDVHRDIIEACILRGAGAEPEIIRQSFGAAKPELQRLMNWLSQNGCYTVAMESTGVYWKPIFQTLELGAEYMEQLWVVNANHMRNLPGRKSDVADAEWIATLLRHGLLEKSFVPPAPIRDLRECQHRGRFLVLIEAPVFTLLFGVIRHAFPCEITTPGGLRPSRGSGSTRCKAADFASFFSVLSGPIFASIATPIP